MVMPVMPRVGEWTVDDLRASCCAEGHRRRDVSVPRALHQPVRSSVLQRMPGASVSGRSVVSSVPSRVSARAT